MSERLELARFDLEFDWRVVWALLFLGGLNLATRTAAEQSASPIDPSTVHRVLVFVSLGCFLVYLASRTELAVPKALFPLFAFLVWQATSSFWSVFPLWTLYRSLEFAVLILFGVVTAHAIDDEDELWWWSTLLFCYFFGIVLLTWAGVVIDPSTALVPTRSGRLPYMLSSVVPRLNPNSVSQVAAVAGIIGIARYHSKRDPLWMAVVGVSLVTMVVSQGRSGMAGFVAGVTVLAIARGYWREVVGLGVLGLAGLVVVPPVRDSVLSLVMRGQAMEMLLTLSGRTHKWTFAFEFMRSDGPFALLFGYGAYAGARFVVMPNDPRIVSSVGTSTHSTWMDLWTDTGLLGMLLFGAAVSLVCVRLVQWWWAQNRTKRLLATEASAVLTVVLVRSIFSRTLILHTSVYFAFVVGFIVFAYMRDGVTDPLAGDG